MNPRRQCAGRSCGRTVERLPAALDGVCSRNGFGPCRCGTGSRRLHGQEV